MLRPLLLLALICSASAQWTLPEDEAGVEADGRHQLIPRVDWDAYRFAQEERLEWFQDQGLGFFVHHGLSCLWAADLSWSRQNHVFPDPGGEQGIPEDEYNAGIERLSMEHFDAIEWARTIREAGFRYVVVIAKHHDGFHLWDTALSEHKVTNSPFGRDFLRELLDACRAEGLAVGIYYSQRDWFHPDYAPLDPALAERAPDPRFWRPREGIAEAEVHPGPNHQRYLDFMEASVIELMSNYGRIHFLWWDSFYHGGMYPSWMWGDIAGLEARVRELQPGILINNRAGLPGDFDTPELRAGHWQLRPWETCDLLGNAWAWTPDSARSLAQVVDQLLRTASANGNLMLSTGGRPDGTLGPDVVELLDQLGAWMEVHGTAVLDTRGGPWQPAAWGGVTRRDQLAWAHVLDADATELRLPLKPDMEVRSARLLDGDQVPFQREGDELVLELPPVGDAPNRSIEIDFAASLPVGPLPAGAVN